MEEQFFLEIENKDILRVLFRIEIPLFFIILHY